MSISLENIPKSVLESYLFSNTPMYLYKHLLSDTYVQELASKFDAERLITEFNDLMDTELDSLEKVAISYSILIALLKKQPVSFKEVFKKLNTTKLEWAAEIIAIGMKQLTPTNTLIINVPGQYRINSENSTTTSLINRK
jgi:hypothetical protein